jgi:hypothetical protein
MGCILEVRRNEPVLDLWIGMLNGSCVVGVAEGGDIFSMRLGRTEKDD